MDSDQLSEVSGQLLTVQVMLSELLFILRKAGGLERGQLENILNTTSVRIDMICHEVNSKMTLPSTTVERIKQHSHRALDLMRRDLEDERRAMSRRVW